MPDIDIAADGSPALDLAPHQLARLAEILSRFTGPDGTPEERRVGNGIVAAFGEHLPLRRKMPHRWALAVVEAEGGQRSSRGAAFDAALAVLSA